MTYDTPIFKDPTKEDLITQGDLVVCWLSEEIINISQAVQVDEGWIKKELIEQYCNLQDWTKEEIESEIKRLKNI